MAADEKTRARKAKDDFEGVPLSTLVDHLGREAAQEFFSRIDGSLRRGNVIVGTTVRDSRSGFARAHKPGHAQFVTPGRWSGTLKIDQTFSDSVVIIKMDDLEAVVKAGQKPFAWGQEFAPRAGLAAAETFPVLKRGSRGRRQLRG